MEYHGGKKSYKSQNPSHSAAGIQGKNEKRSITNLTPTQFCYIKAMQVLHEYWRRPEQKEIALEDLRVNDPSDQHTFLGTNPNDEQDEQEHPTISVYAQFTHIRTIGRRDGVNERRTTERL